MYNPEAVSSCSLEVVAQAFLPTRFGQFEMFIFRETNQTVDTYGLSTEHVALVMGEVAGAKHVPVRVHSECLTSEVFGSLKCDCKEQLELAQAEIARKGQGVILYLRQEGRGIGLVNKIKAYALQAGGADTVDANRLLGLPDDARKYDVAAAMIRKLRIESVVLMTNNPQKIESLQSLGIDVAGNTSILAKTNPLSSRYLETKRLRMRHVLPSAIETAEKRCESKTNPPGSCSHDQQV